MLLKFYLIYNKVRYFSVQITNYVYKRYGIKGGMMIVYFDYPEGEGAIK